MYYRDVIRKHGIKEDEVFLMQTVVNSTSSKLCNEKHKLCSNGLWYYGEAMMRWIHYGPFSIGRITEQIESGMMVITKKETELEAAKRQLEELTVKVEELEAEARGGRAKYQGTYYCVDFDNHDVDEMTEIGSGYDVSMFERGNYFINKQDAEDCLEVLKEALTTFREERGL